MTAPCLRDQPINLGDEILGFFRDGVRGIGVKSLGTVRSIDRGRGVLVGGTWRGLTECPLFVGREAAERYLREHPPKVPFAT